MLIMLSGGMDSQVLLAQWKLRLERSGVPLAALFINYDQKNFARELTAANIQVGVYKVPLYMASVGAFTGSKSRLLDGKNQTESTILPFRNQVLISTACAQAKILGHSAVSCALHLTTDDFKDSGHDFLMAMRQLCCMQGIILDTPFENIRKKDIALWGYNHGVNFRQSYSCYTGNDKPCGKCHACKSRKEALAWLTK